MNSGLYVAGTITDGKASLTSGALSGATSISAATLILSGDASLNSGLSIEGDVSMNSSLYIAGALSGATTVSATALILSGDASLNGDLHIEGDVSMNNNLYVAGHSDTTGQLSINRMLGTNASNSPYLRLLADIDGVGAVPSDYHAWDLLAGYSGSTNLGFAFRTTVYAYISSTVDVGALDFTGQHRSVIKDISPSAAANYKGLIVSACNNDYISIKKDIQRGKNAIQINEALPVVSLSAIEKDKKCYGVISGIEDTDDREYHTGSFVSVFEKQYGDSRVHINSVGEGAMWVCNKGGSLESGDYITSSVGGYGQIQDDDILHNYTVSKITMDCDFQPTLQPIKVISTKSIYAMDANGNWNYNVDTNGNWIVGDVIIYKPSEQWKHKDYIFVYDTAGSLIEVKQNIIDTNEHLVWEDSNVMEYEYEMRFINASGTTITESEYNTIISNGGLAYKCAFVGCTYHCG
jgi:hypothetical protein